MAYELRKDVTSPDTHEKPPEYGDGWCFMVLNHAQETCTILSKYGLGEMVMGVLNETENLEVIIITWD